MAAFHARKLDVDSTELAFHLATLYQHVGKLHSALDIYDVILQRQPRHVGALLNSAACFQGLGRTNDAITRFSAITDLDQNNVEAQYNLIIALIETGSLQRAEALVKVLKTDDRASWERAQMLRALIMDHNGRYMEALASMEPWIGNALYSNSVIIYGNIAKQASNVHVRTAIEILTNWHRTNAIRLTPAESRAALFALGALYDRASEWRNAFQCYKQANGVWPPLFDRKPIHDLWVSISEFCTKKPIFTGGSSRKIVFIVGMPRSGTSLMEKIITATENTYGAGEVSEIGRIAQEISGGVMAQYPRALSELTECDVDRYAARYMRALGNISDSVLVLDKMPSNFQFVGLIFRLFPYAKVIYMKRDLRDTCLSCYFQNFSGVHPYKYRLPDIKYYYQIHESMMEAWASVYQKRILSVSYEELVLNFEKETKAVLDFIGLQWHERISRFFLSNTPCVTSSYQQVRSPIYKSAVGRWRNYKEFLGELM